MYNLIPRASCLSDIGRRGLSIIGHLNINSIRNKFEMLPMSVVQYVDILMLSETKLDCTFPSIQSLINGFSVPHRLDQNSKNYKTTKVYGQSCLTLLSGATSDTFLFHHHMK